MGTICAPDQADKSRPRGTGRSAKVADQPYYSSSSSDDSDWSNGEEDPDHTPQPSRDDIENDRVRQGLINAFENGNETLVMHLIDDYPELELLSHIFENGDDCLRRAVRNEHDPLVVFCLEENAYVKWHIPLSISRSLLYHNAI